MPPDLLKCGLPSGQTHRECRTRRMLINAIPDTHKVKALI